MAETVQEQVAEKGVSDLETGVVTQKLLNRVAWGLTTPYSGQKAGSIRQAVKQLKELGYSKEGILAEAVGSEKALEILENKELRIF